MNNLTDLNALLFEQLRRLSNTELNQDDLKTEIERTRSITSVSANIVSNARLMLDPQNSLLDTPNFQRQHLPPVLS